MHLALMRLKASMPWFNPRTAVLVDDFLTEQRILIVALSVSFFPFCAPNKTIGDYLIEPSQYPD